MQRWIFQVVVGLSMIASIMPMAFAIDFRIDTKLFTPGSKAPTGQNLTLFADGKVYDFARELTPEGEPSRQQEIAIFDTSLQKFYLLDTARQARMEIDCKQLGQFALDLRVEARKGNNEGVKFAADPKFTENFNRSSGLLTLTSGVIDYRVDTVRPESPAAADQYGQFADWYARLNSTHPGAAPPFPRIYLNDVLVKHGVIPTRVERTITGGASKSTAWTEHQVSWQLTRTDRNEITKAEGYLVDFKLLSFGEYRQIAVKK